MTFGAEPKDYDVRDFIIRHLYGLKFSPAVKVELKQTADNPKRRQRNAGKQMLHTGIGTKSQQALQKQREEMMTERRQITNKYLSDFREKIAKEGVESFLSLDGSIRREYEGGKPVIVTLSDIVFRGEIQLDPGNCPVRIFQAESPHTDDSTLVEVMPDRVLILGDSTSGLFPEWTMDPVLAGKLAATIRGVDPEICVHGHLPPSSPEEMIREMLGWI